jgi:hypothetical protein
LFENSWWLALAWHLSVSEKLPDAFSYLGLLIGAEVLNALARASIVRYYGKSISELVRFGWRSPGTRGLGTVGFAESECRPLDSTRLVFLRAERFQEG